MKNQCANVDIVVYVQYFCLFCRARLNIYDRYACFVGAKEQDGQVLSCTVLVFEALVCLKALDGREVLWQGGGKLGQHRAGNDGQLVVAVGDAVLGEIVGLVCVGNGEVEGVRLDRKSVV